MLLRVQVHHVTPHAPPLAHAWLHAPAVPWDKPCIIAQHFLQEAGQAERLVPRQSTLEHAVPSSALQWSKFSHVPSGDHQRQPAREHDGRQAVAPGCAAHEHGVECFCSDGLELWQRCCVQVGKHSCQQLAGDQLHPSVQAAPVGRHIPSSCCTGGG